MSIILDQDAEPNAAATELIRDTDGKSFAADVIDASREVPIIVDFWAPWCGPCKTLTPALEKAVTQAGGLVRLVKVNVDENQALAAQLQIQSIPTVLAFKDGKMVDAFMGAVADSQLKKFVAALTKGAVSPLDQALGDAKDALEQGQAELARDIYAEILRADDNNPSALAGLLRCCLALDDSEGAARVIDGLPSTLKSHPEVTSAMAAFELSKLGNNAGNAGDLEARLKADPEDHQARFELAEILYADGKVEESLNHLLEIVRRHRAWGDGAARARIVRIFEAQGHADPVVVAARRHLSALLFS